MAAQTPQEDGAQQSTDPRHHDRLRVKWGSAGWAESFLETQLIPACVGAVVTTR
jgi:hypothetical protein